MVDLSGYFSVARRRGLPLAAGLFIMFVAGCSGGGMFGSDNSPLPLPPPLEAGADGVVPDNTGRNNAETASTDDTADTADAGDTGTSADTGTSGDSEYPDLADVPEGDAATKKAENTADAKAQREQLANELIADRDQAKYTDEELRGGRVPAVAPPRQQPPAAPRAPEPQPATEAPPPAVPQKPVTTSEPLSPPLPPPGRIAAPVPAPATPARPQASPAPVAAAPARAAAPPPLTSQTPRAAPKPAAAPPAPTYSSTTFEPSKAPPLSPDLVAALPPSIAQRYQETLRQPLPGAPAALPITPAIGRGGAAFVSIAFASGSSRLSASDQRTVAEVADAAKSRGSNIRVVGHASSTAGSQSESQRLLANWEVSQARATAVADELVRYGVDASKLTIEAMGDNQAGNTGGYSDDAGRRVDLFLE